MTLHPDPVAYVELLGGALRPVFEEPSGRQYVDDDGAPVYGVWFIPREECGQALIVEAPYNGTGGDENSSPKLVQRQGLI